MGWTFWGSARTCRQVHGGHYSAGAGCVEEAVIVFNCSISLRRVSSRNGGNPSITLLRSVTSRMRSRRSRSLRSQGHASRSVVPVPNSVMQALYHRVFILQTTNRCPFCQRKNRRTFAIVSRDCPSVVDSAEFTPMRPVPTAKSLRPCALPGTVRRPLASRHNSLAAMRRSRSGFLL